MQEIIEKIENIIGKRFGILEENLDGFTKRENKGINDEMVSYRLKSGDEKRGYYISMGKGSSDEYLNDFEYAKDIYEEREIKKEFIDKKERMAGFYWEKEG